MYSMNRTQTSFARAKSAKSATSSSFIPRITTQLIFGGGKPAAMAASIPSSTDFSASRLVMLLKVSGLRESQLIVRRLRPADLRAEARFLSPAPLLVIARSQSPGILDSRIINNSISFRTSGSPPVKRSFSTARPTKRDPIGKINFASVVHTLAAFVTNHSRARVAGQIFPTHLNFNVCYVKQLFFGRFTVGSHLALVLVLDFRMTQVSQTARRFKCN